MEPAVLNTHTRIPEALLPAGMTAEDKKEAPKTCKPDILIKTKSKGKAPA